MVRPVCFAVTWKYCPESWYLGGFAKLGAPFGEPPE